MEIVFAAIIGAVATLAATLLSYWLKVRHDRLNKHRMLKDHVVIGFMSLSSIMEILITQEVLNKNLAALTK